jgi:hypothetical protein
MRTTLLAVVLLSAVIKPLHAQCGDPHAPHSVMNARFERIWIDADSPGTHECRNASLDPSQSEALTGELVYLKVRLKIGRLLQYRQHDIAVIRNRSHIQTGDWVVDRSGLRFVSCAERQQLFETVQKSLVERFHKTMQPRASHTLSQIDNAL